MCQAWIQCGDDARGRVCLSCARHGYSAEMTRVGGCAYHVPGMDTGNGSFRPVESFDLVEGEGPFLSWSRSFF